MIAKKITLWGMAGVFALSRTLSDHNLQYEALRAQKAVATSGRNNTIIYVPSGANGVPLVQDPQNVNQLRSAPSR